MKLPLMTWWTGCDPSGTVGTVPPRSPAAASARARTDPGDGGRFAVAGRG